MRCLPKVKCDVVVIGGGAAGLLCAGTAAERGRSVVLLEPNESCGRKLRITGKGRCNITNDCGVKEFLQNVPTNPKFLYSALNAFSPENVKSFFEELGVAVKTERGQRVFPQSDSAHEVADALTAWVKRAGVKILQRKALEIQTHEGTVCAVKCAEGLIECKAAVLCTGGKSYPLTGSRGDGYRMAGALGHSVTPLRASLVPLESPDGFCETLAGFAPRNVSLTILEDNKPIFKEKGEMLFAHFGITGPLVLSASAHMRRYGEKSYTALIDFKPALTEEKLDERLLRDFAKYSNRDFANALDELAAKSFIPVLVARSGIPANRKVHSITREQRKGLVTLLKAFPIRISGPRPIEDAIITSGGVEVAEVNPRSMESKLVTGLYFAGEILDVDAYTGGFNLQIAWSTGRCAGQHA